MNTDSLNTTHKLILRDWRATDYWLDFMSICNPIIVFGHVTDGHQVIDNTCEMTCLSLSFSFPACHFGKLYGMVMSISAVFSLLQYPCFALVKGALGGDPFYVGARESLWERAACPTVAVDRSISKCSACQRVKCVFICYRWTSLWLYSLCWCSYTLSTSSSTAGKQPANERKAPRLAPKWLKPSYRSTDNRLKG